MTKPRQLVVVSCLLLTSDHTGSWYIGRESHSHYFCVTQCMPVWQPKLRYCPGKVGLIYHSLAQLNLNTRAWLEQTTRTCDYQDGTRNLGD